MPRTVTSCGEKGSKHLFRAAPTVADGTLYFTGSSNEVFALRTSDGGQLWNYHGTGSQASIVSSTSPAVSQGLVVIPTTSGELVAYKVTDGLEAWSDSLTSVDPVSAAGNIGAIAGRPVIDGSQVFAISKRRQDGGLFARGRRNASGRRIFQGRQTPWVAGDYVFVHLQWPHVDGVVEAQRRRAFGAFSWPASRGRDGARRQQAAGGEFRRQARSVSAETGQVLQTTDMGGAFYISPVIASGTVYLLNGRCDRDRARR